MGRLHTHNHGKSHSTRPFPSSAPKWVTEEPKKIEELIQNGGMYWIKDEDGEIGINAKQIHSVEFVDDTDKREAGLV